jgi:acetyl-CoA carboxylase carboxyl transferase beta subunit/acetyl-CoA carboxylase carboxyl transferase alpha subunit
MLEDIFKKVKNRMADTPITESHSVVKIPSNLWFKCPRCQNEIFQEEYVSQMKVCPKCGYHSRITAAERLGFTIDEGSLIEFDKNMSSLNPIDFPGYEEKIEKLQKLTGLKEAVITGECTIGGERTVIGIMDSNFMMASMGSVVGEKITRAFEHATANSLPIVLFTASGGARMQEGIVSLMQMAKTSGAAARHSDAGNLYITVLTDPTTGGVTASFASLGDIIIAEPKVLVGFAGRRVIEDTIKQRLPDEFQSAEFMLAHGFVDMIIMRRDMRDVLTKLLKSAGCSLAAEKAEPKTSMESLPSEKPVENISGKQQKCNISAWEHIEIIKHKNRPTIKDYIPMIFDEYFEMHGDRLFADDCAITGGIASFKGQPVTIVGMVKGKNLEENKKCNFAMPSPEGYRKALRIMKQAEKFHRPVICFVDTPGANCSIEAEERGQGEAIAKNIFEMMRLQTPIITIILGEAGSGGALALAVCDELDMLENSTYSVISPRGFSSILWKDSSREKEAAELLKMTATDLVGLRVADHIIPEPIGGAHNNPQLTAATILTYIDIALNKFKDTDKTELLNNRYMRFRKIGVFEENQAQNPFDDI